MCCQNCWLTWPGALAGCLSSDKEKQRKALPFHIFLQSKNKISNQPAKVTKTREASNTAKQQHQGQQQTKYKEKGSQCKGRLLKKMPLGPPGAQGQKKKWVLLGKPLFYFFNYFSLILINKKKEVFLLKAPR